MSPKIRILTFHHIPNNGAFLFSYSLLKLFQKTFSKSDIKILDYQSNRLAFYEYLKRFNFFQSIPLFYMRRAQMWIEQLNLHLEMDNTLPLFANNESLQKHFSRNYDAMVVGMDVWCIINSTERPKFPNIYWLPKKISIPKIAYCISAYNSNPKLVAQSVSQIREYLNEFDVIGVRDHFTYQLVQEHRTRQDGLIELLPDPTFTYEFRETRVAEKITSLGVDLNRPILGFLLFGDNALSKIIRSHYKSKGYQILAMSMYNPAADFNLGHILTPFEWAEAFRYLSFCITDRFHGTVFCLLNQIPFISFEKDRHLPKNQSKLYDLLASFNLDTCYQNPADESFDVTHVLEMANEFEKNWDKTFKSNIMQKLELKKLKHVNFINKMKNNLAI